MRLVLTAALLASLVLPAAAPAAFTGSVAAGVATLQGSDSVETLAIGQSGAVLTHGRLSAGDPGFSSDADWDSTAAGEQAVPADGSVDVVVNLGGGDDILLPVATTGFKLLTADGQAGSDSLGGSSKGDVLRGGAGEDRITPGPGADTVAGGDDDDLMLWDNGHGSDVFDGDGGFDTLSVAGANVGEAYAVTMSGQRSRIERSGLGPFSIDFTAELTAAQLRGGDDTLTVADGVPSVVSVDGGSGNDTLTGGTGADVLTGGSGDDRLTGSAGSDVLLAGDGNDTVAARDSTGDYASCGAGTDSATVDGPDLDVLADCETADRPAVIAPAAPIGLTVLTKAVKVRKGTVSLKVRCPDGGGCKGRLTLRTEGKLRTGRARVPVVLASKAYSVAAGATRTVKLRMPSGYRTVSRARRLKAKLSVLHATLPATSRSLTVTLR